MKKLKKHAPRVSLGNRHRGNDHKRKVGIVERRARGDGMPRGPHYFLAVNFTQTVLHLSVLDWRDASVVMGG